MMCKGKKSENTYLKQSDDDIIIFFLMCYPGIPYAPPDTCRWTNHIHTRSFAFTDIFTVFEYHSGLLRIRMDSKYNKKLLFPIHTALSKFCGFSVLTRYPKCD